MDSDKAQQLSSAIEVALCEMMPGLEQSLQQHQKSSALKLNVSFDLPPTPDSIFRKCCYFDVATGQWLCRDCYTVEAKIVVMASQD